MQSIDFYLLWCAALLLGVKYKMTALKIHSAVCHSEVTDRRFYRDVMVRYGGLFALSTILELYWFISYFRVYLSGAPFYLFVIGATFGLVMIVLLGLTYYETFIHLKEALNETTSNDVSVRNQVIYLLFLALLASIEMAITCLDYFSLTSAYVLLKTLGMLTRISAQILLMA